MRVIRKFLKENYTKNQETSYTFSLQALSGLKYPGVISLKEGSADNPKHKIIDFNFAFSKKFLFFIKSDEISFLEDLFGPVFHEPGLTFFTFEHRFYYLFNLPLNELHKFHIFIEENEWLKFPHWFHTEKLASLGRLAGEISHEIKNPLSGILLYATMLKEEIGDDPVYKDWIERIIQLTTRCKIITNALLDFGKPEKGNKEWINFNEVAQNVYNMLSDYQIFRNIKINWRLYDKLPYFYANKLQIEQVFFNIFINAAEAMKGYGEITVETSIKNDNIIIKIKDTGPGIPSEVMPFVFDPFFTTKNREKGTGLGLSICYGIVKNHRGKIKVYNLKDGGACFEIQFPLQTREALREDEV